MADGPNIGYATLSIIPSLRGAEAAIAKGLGPQIERSSADAGDKSSAAFSGRFSSGLKGAGAKAGKLLAAGVLGGGAVAVAGVGFLAHLGGIMDSANDIIREKTGQTGAVLAGLDKSFTAVLKTVPSSADDVATALSGINQRLGLTGKPLEDLTSQVLLLSKVTDTDLNTNLQSLVPLLTQWGVKGAETTGVVNELFRASQKSGVGVADLAGQLVGSGVQLRAAGFDLNKSVGLLALLGKSGLSASDVIPAISKSLAAAAKAGKPAAKFFHDTFEQIRNAPNDTKAAGDAVTVFGTRAGPKLAALIRTGKLSYEQFAKSISKGDTISAAAKDTFDWQEKLKILGNRLSAGLAPLAGKVFDAIGTGADVAGVLLSKAFGKNGIGTRALDGLQSVLGTAGKFISGGFAAIIDGIKFPTEDLSKKSGFDRIFQGLGAGIAGAATAVKGAIPSIVSGVKSILPTLIAFGGQLTDLFVAHLVPLFVNFGRAVLPGLLSAGQNIGKLFTGSIVPAFRELVDFTSTKVVPIVALLADKLSGFLGFLASHQGAVKTFAKVALGLLAARFAALKINQAVSGIRKFGSELASNVKSVINFGKSIASTVQSTISFAKNMLMGAANIAEQTAAFLLQKGAAIASSVATKAMAAAQWLLNAAMDANPIGLLIVGIAALVAGFVLAYQHITPFRNAVDAVGRAALVAGKFILAAFSGAFGWLKSHWPLVLAILTGPIGIAVLLITKNWDKITAGFRAVKDFIGTAVGGIVGFVTGIPGRVAGTVSHLWDGLKRGITVAKNWVHDRIDNVVGFVTGLPGRIASAASGMWDSIGDGFRSVINGIIRGWNGIEFKIPKFDPLGKFGPSVGGFTLGLPDIPELRALGGEVLRHQPYLVGERGPELFQPSMNGRILSNRATTDLLKSSARTKAPVEQHIDAHIEYHNHDAQMSAADLALLSAQQAFRVRNMGRVA